MGEHDTSFSAQEAVAVQRALREALGLGPEAFPLQAFVGMISDEIEQLRASGRSDAEVAAVIRETIGREVEPAAIARFYAPAGVREKARGGE